MPPLDDRLGEDAAVGVALVDQGEDLDRVNVASSAAAPSGKTLGVRLSGRTIGYVAVMGLIVVAVVFLMTKMARTELANRRLITIAAVVVGTALVVGLGTLAYRGRSGRGE